jgi:hypothetical protein
MSKNKVNHEEAQYNILTNLKNYMLDCKNLRQFTKHIIKKHETTNLKPDSTNIKKYESNVLKKDIYYKPKQKDSLFWCFYILKHGLSNYEMEIGNQHFVVEKKEKFKYVELLRDPKIKDKLKIHKIKPLTLLEDDLANQDRISVKTFFALCVQENLNVVLIDKRKIYEIQTTDDPKIHIIHRNSTTYEHHIELDIANIKTYKETYYKMESFDVSLKAISSYKLDELTDLCKQLDININSDKKKKTKKDIYELLIQNL